MLIMLNIKLQELYELYKNTECEKTREIIQQQIDQILKSQAKL